MHAPEFWQRDGWPARALAPVGALIELAGRCRAALTTPFVAPVPVICIGNLTVGGTGKTPIAIATAQRLVAKGEHPVFLSRGHGGARRGPLQVDPARHDAGAIGDEPLLLAAVAPVVVARDRAAGAREAVLAGATAIVMDDGLQNPGLAKSLAVVVVDGETGFGNGRVFPAGPLRESVARGTARADAFVVMGEDRLGLAARLAAHATVLAARLEPEPAPHLAGRRCLAFAGIGRPAKFFATLAGLGAEVVERHAFPDHHPYTAAEIERLLDRARRCALHPVTTAKDHVRLPAALRPLVDVVAVRAVFAAPERYDALLEDALDG